MSPILNSLYLSFCLLIWKTIGLPQIGQNKVSPKSKHLLKCSFFCPPNFPILSMGLEGGYFSSNSRGLSSYVHPPLVQFPIVQCSQHLFSREHYSSLALLYFSAFNTFGLVIGGLGIDNIQIRDQGCVCPRSFLRPMEAKRGKGQVRTGSSTKSPELSWVSSYFVDSINEDGIINHNLII